MSESTQEINHTAVKSANVHFPKPAIFVAMAKFTLEKRVMIVISNLVKVEQPESLKRYVMLNPRNMSNLEK